MTGNIDRDSSCDSLGSSTSSSRAASSSPVSSTEQVATTAMASSSRSSSTSLAEHCVTSELDRPDLMAVAKQWNYYRAGAKLAAQNSEQPYNRDCEPLIYGREDPNGGFTVQCVPREYLKIHHGFTDELIKNNGTVQHESITYYTDPQEIAEKLIERGLTSGDKERCTVLIAALQEKYKQEKARPESYSLSEARRLENLWRLEELIAFFTEGTAVGEQKSTAGSRAVAMTILEIASSARIASSSVVSGCTTIREAPIAASSSSVTKSLASEREEAFQGEHRPDLELFAQNWKVFNEKAHESGKSPIFYAVERGGRLTFECGLREDVRRNLDFTDQQMATCRVAQSSSKRIYYFDPQMIAERLVREKLSPLDKERCKPLVEALEAKFASMATRPEPGIGIRGRMRSVFSSAQTRAVQQKLQQDQKQQQEEELAHLGDLIEAFAPTPQAAQFESPSVWPDLNVEKTKSSSSSSSSSVDSMQGPREHRGDLEEFEKTWPTLMRGALQDPKNGDKLPVYYGQRVGNTFTFGCATREEFRKMSECTDEQVREGGQITHHETTYSLDAKEIAEQLIKENLTPLDKMRCRGIVEELQKQLKNIPRLNEPAHVSAIRRLEWLIGSLDPSSGFVGGNYSSAKVGVNVCDSVHLDPYNRVGVLLDAAGHNNRETARTLIPVHRKIAGIFTEQTKRCDSAEALKEWMETHNSEEFGREFAPVVETTARASKLEGSWVQKLGDDIEDWCEDRSRIHEKFTREFFLEFREKISIDALLKGVNGLAQANPPMLGAIGMIKAIDRGDYDAFIDLLKESPIGDIREVMSRCTPRSPSYAPAAAIFTKIVESSDGRERLYVGRWSDCSYFIQKADGTVHWNADLETGLVAHGAGGISQVVGAHHVIPLDPGDMFFAFSDGIGDFLTQAELERIVSENHLLGVNAIEVAIRDELEKHAKSDYGDRYEKRPPRGSGKNPEGYRTKAIQPEERAKKWCKDGIDASCYDDMSFFMLYAKPKIEGSPIAPASTLSSSAEISSLSSLIMTNPLQAMDRREGNRTDLESVEGRWKGLSAQAKGTKPYNPGNEPIFYGELGINNQFLIGCKTRDNFSVDGKTTTEEVRYQQSRRNGEIVAKTSRGDFRSYFLDPQFIAEQLIKEPLTEQDKVRCKPILEALQKKKAHAITALNTYRVTDKKDFEQLKRRDEEVPKLQESIQALDRLIKALSPTALEEMTVDFSLQTSSAASSSQSTGEVVQPRKDLQRIVQASPSLVSAVGVSSHQEDSLVYYGKRERGVLMLECMTLREFKEACHCSDTQIQVGVMEDPKGITYYFDAKNIAEQLVHENLTMLDKVRCWPILEALKTNILQLKSQGAEGLSELQRLEGLAKALSPGCSFVGGHYPTAEIGYTVCDHVYVDPYEREGVIFDGVGHGDPEVVRDQFPIFESMIDQFKAAAQACNTAEELKDWMETHGLPGFAKLFDGLDRDYAREAAPLGSVYPEFKGKLAEYRESHLLKPSEEKKEIICELMPQEEFYKFLNAIDFNSLRQRSSKAEVSYNEAKDSPLLKRQVKLFKAIQEGDYNRFVEQLAKVSDPDVIIGFEQAFKQKQTGFNFAINAPSVLFGKIMKNLEGKEFLCIAQRGDSCYLVLKANGEIKTPPSFAKTYEVEPLEPGDVVFGFSDGIGEFFSLEELQKIVQENHLGGTDAVEQAVRRELGTHPKTKALEIVDPSRKQAIRPRANVRKWDPTGGDVSCVDDFSFFTLYAQPSPFRMDLEQFEKDWVTLSRSAERTQPKDPDLKPVLYCISGADGGLEIKCMTLRQFKGETGVTEGSISSQQEMPEGKIAVSGEHGDRIFYLNPQFIAEQLVKNNLTVLDKTRCWPIVEALKTSVLELRSQGTARASEIQRLEELIAALTPISAFVGGHYPHARVGYNVCDYVHVDPLERVGVIIDGVGHGDQVVVNDQFPVFKEVVQEFKTKAKECDSAEEVKTWMQQEGEAVFQTIFKRLKATNDEFVNTYEPIYTKVVNDLYEYSQEQVETLDLTEKKEKISEKISEEDFRNFQTALGKEQIVNTMTILGQSGRLHHLEHAFETAKIMEAIQQGDYNLFIETLAQVPQKAIESLVRISGLRRTTIGDNAAVFAKIMETKGGQEFLYTGQWSDCCYFIKKADGSVKQWASEHWGSGLADNGRSGRHQVVPLDPGDVVFAFSDGIGAFLSREELMQIVGDHHLVGAHAIEGAIRKQLAQYPQENPKDRYSLDRGRASQEVASTEKAKKWDATGRNAGNYDDMGFFVLYAKPVVQGSPSSSESRSTAASSSSQAASSSQ